MFPRISASATLASLALLVFILESSLASFQGETTLNETRDMPSSVRNAITRPRFIAKSQTSRPMKHFLRGYKEQCSTQAPFAPTFVPSTGQTLLPDSNTSQCAFIYVCFHSTCRCPLGHAHLTSFNESLGTVHQCSKFSEFRCHNDTQCQDIDSNVVCHSATRQCRCKSGFAIESETGYCKKTYEKYKMQSLINVFKMKDRATASTAPVPTQSHQFFQNSAECKTKSQCNGEYTYCHRGRCKCWPEFQFVPGYSLLPFNASRDNQTTELDVANEANDTAGDDIFAYGYCVRKLCQLDSQCQTEDNPNLVCNKTICECRYGYIMYKETKICMKYVLRRQSCDLTCRIIGGLFASIFMLTLIYWCFYCCYSIVKNYRNHRIQSRCHDATYMGNIYEFEPIDYERYLSANTLNRNPNRNASRFPGNLSTFLRFPLNDDPPSYNQAMADETLPEYDAVMELQELRKAENKAE